MVISSGGTVSGTLRLLAADVSIEGAISGGSGLGVLEAWGVVTAKAGISIDTLRLVGITTLYWRCIGGERYNIYCLFYRHFQYRVRVWCTAVCGVRCAMWWDSDCACDCVAVALVGWVLTEEVRSRLHPSSSMRRLKSQAIQERSQLLVRSLRPYRVFFGRYKSSLRD